LKKVLEYIKISAVWFVAACFLFNFVVYFYFRLGLVKETRNEKGALKKRQSVKGILSMLGLSFIIVAALYSYNLFLFAGDANAAFMHVFAANFVMLMLLVAYDSFAIDMLVIGVIKPRFLDIPSEMTLEEMKKHVKVTYTYGWVLIIPLILISSIIYYFIH
jgi:hypothetical protein